MKYQTSIAALALLLIVSSVVITLRQVNDPLPVDAVTATEDIETLTAPVANNNVQLAGAYSGAVVLDVTVGGVFSNTLVIPVPEPDETLPDLGTIDLSLSLTETNDIVSGYVSLDETLVFNAEHTVTDGVETFDIGPYVTGVISNSIFSLQSEKVSTVIGGQMITRQFQLTGMSVISDGRQIEGEYRETVWGYTNKPVTVIGSFSLERPVFGEVTGQEVSAPVASADQVSTPTDTPIIIDVLANDSAANGATLTITSVSEPQFGTASTNGQTITYTPESDFAGTDNFSYLITDSNGNLATGSVIVIVGQNDGNIIYLPFIQH